mmetsp:Transcript_44703/g.96109  ORF Transcript_44703/g.96109 Transcript_44703/m.96109 type:complete len:357 (+) Transcript_44703:750-1820(+)
MSVHAAQRSVFCESFGTPDLNSSVQNPAQHLCSVGFGSSKLDLRVAASVHLLGCSKRHEAMGDELAVGIIHMFSHQLQFSEGHRSAGHASTTSRYLPLNKSFAHDVECPLRLSDPPHAVEDTTRSKTLLGDQKPLTPLSDDVGKWDPNVVVEDLGVAAVTSKDVGASQDVVALRLRWNADDGKGLMSWSGRRFGSDHDVGEFGVLCPGCPPLSSVDDPLPSLLVHLGLCLDPSGIRRQKVRFRHGEGGVDVCLNDAVQVFSFDVFRSMIVEHEGVLQRVRSKTDRANLAATLDLVNVDVVPERHTLTPDLHWVSQSPETSLFALGLDGFELLVHGWTGSFLSKPLFIGVNKLFDET